MQPWKTTRIGHKKCMAPLLIAVASWAVTTAAQVPVDTAFADPSLRQMAIELGEFIQVPGPNPILRPGPD